VKKVLFFLLIFTSFFIHANEVSLFDQVTQISDEYMELIEDDFENIDDEKLFYYFVLVSEESSRLDEFLEFYRDLKIRIELDAEKDYGTTNVAEYTDSMKKQFAESLLVYLHKSPFKEYNFDSNKISEIIDFGRYNCVSSSILYAILLKKYGFLSNAIETSDHVFIEVVFQNDKIDVETTNKFGFNPGTKKEALDNFGKVTGFNYVSPKDYKNRNKIDLKKLLFLLSHNLANYYYKSRNFIKSANLGYIIYLGRGDNKGKEEFDVYFNNLLVNLTDKKEYKKGIELVNEYLEAYGFSENFVKLRFDLINNFINGCGDFENFEELNAYVLNENSKYEQLKDNKRFIDSYFYLIYKAVTFYNKKQNFDKSFELLKDFKENYRHKDAIKLFSNTMIDNMDILFKNNDMEVFRAKIESLKSLFKDFSPEIEKYEKIYMINFVNNILKSGDIEKALSEAKKLKNVYPNDASLLSLLKSCYVKYTVSFYEKKEIEDTINYSLEALTFFPQDSTLINNFKAFFQNFIFDALEKKDLSKARKLTDRALEIFDKESYFIQVDKTLKERNY